MKKDLNFFSPLQTPPAKPSRAGIGAVVGGLVLAAAMVALTGWLMLENSNMENEIRTKRSEMENVEFKKQLERVDMLTAEKATITNDKDVFELLSGTFRVWHRVNEAFLNLLHNNLPTNVSVTDLQVKERAIELSGISNDRLAIAKFEEELRKTDKFNRILVSEIKVRQENAEQPAVNGPATTAPENPTNPVYEFQIKIEIEEGAVFEDAQ